MADTATVDTKCEAYARMEEAWALPNDLRGGTRAMRLAGERWLPKEAKEKDKAYLRRLLRSVLFNAYGDTVDGLSAKPFRKPVTLQGQIPPALEVLERNADGQGQSLTQFARMLFKDGVHFGKAHFYVDYPSTGGTQNPLQELQGEVRPVFAHISPDRLIGWQDTGGFPRELTQIRVKALGSKSFGSYGSTETETIRVYTQTEVVVHEQQADGKWIAGQPTPIKFKRSVIPLVTVYFRRTGFMTAEPALDDLAWMNLAHWQSNSDQRNILRYARIPVLWKRGRLTNANQDPTRPDDVEFGPGAVLQSTDQNFAVGFVEHSGAAIKSGSDDIVDIERKMELLGMKPFVANSGNQTATGKILDDDNAHCDMAAWVRALETGLREGYALAADWVGAELQKDFKVDIFSEFGLYARAAEESRLLHDMRKGGDLSQETLLKEVKRRGVLSETLDVKEEMDRIEDEGPALGDLGGFGFGGGMPFGKKAGDPTAVPPAPAGAPIPPDPKQPPKFLPDRGAA